MSDPPAIVFQEFRRYRRQYVEYSDGTKLTRRVHKATFVPLTPWTAVLSPPASSSSSSAPLPVLHLSLVVEHQAAGEPKHWSLLCHREDDPRGRLWQVTGDAERMHYAHLPDAGKLSGGGGGDVAWRQVLNGELTAAQRATVEEVVGTEPPPRANIRADVKENCQGWVMRVLRRLAAEGIVEEIEVDKLWEQMDPLK